MILIFNSCVPEEEPVVVPVSDLQQAVEDAKEWFGPQEEFEIPVTSAAKARVRSQIKKIHWNKAVVHEEGRVIEVEITYNITSVPIRAAKTINDIKQKQRDAFFRLILEKRADGGYDKFILKYFPDGTAANQKKLEVNNYTVWSKDFSGDIQMISWDEELSTGWYVQHGEKVYTYFPKSESGKKSRSNTNAALNCTPIMEEVCFSFGDDNEQMDCSTGICELPEHSVEVECFDIIAYEDPACSDQYNPGSGPGTYTGPGGGGGSGSGTGGGGPTLLPDDCNTSKENLKSVFPNSEDNTLQSIADYINTHGETFGIDTPEKLHHFLAQAGHESTNYAGKEFGAFEENLNYRWARLGEEDYWERYFNTVSNPTADPTKANPYDYQRSSTSDFVDGEKLANLVYDRETLGNTSLGDGYKYRGRGIIQLTGKSNYQSFTNFYQNAYNSTLNFVTNPDLISSNLELGVISALWFFKEMVQSKLIINSATSVEKVTLKINGGTKGLPHRKALFSSAVSNIICL